jgi:hypothetical protein
MFKDVRWERVAGKVFHALSAPHKEAWKLAYEHYHTPDAQGNEKLSYDLDFLARPELWSRGRLLPGFSQDAPWPPYLSPLYSAFYDCVQYVSTALPRTRDEIGWPMHQVSTLVDEVLAADHESGRTMPDQLRSKLNDAYSLLQDGLNNLQDIVWDASLVNRDYLNTKLQEYQG